MLILSGYIREPPLKLARPSRNLSQPVHSVTLKDSHAAGGHQLAVAAQRDSKNAVLSSATDILSASSAPDFGMPFRRSGRTSKAVEVRPVARAKLLDEVQLAQLRTDLVAVPCCSHRCFTFIPDDVI